MAKVGENRSYGSKYNANSIFNQYRTYGSDYSMYSPFNKYSNNGPWLMDCYGNYYGRLSINKYAQGVTLEGKTALMYALENYTEPDIAYFLIFAGANCSAEDKNGKTVSEYLQKNVSLRKSELNKIIMMSQNNGENNFEAVETSSEKIDDKEFIEIENKIDSVNTSVEISDESEEKNDAL